MIFHKLKTIFYDNGARIAQVIADKTRKSGVIPSSEFQRPS